MESLLLKCAPNEDSNQPAHSRRSEFSLSACRNFPSLAIQNAYSEAQDHWALMTESTFSDVATHFIFTKVTAILCGVLWKGNYVSFGLHLILVTVILHSTVLVLSTCLLEKRIPGKLWDFITGFSFIFRRELMN